MRRFGRLWAIALALSLVSVPLFAGRASAAATTYYGVTGHLAGRTILWSGSTPAGGTLQANIGGTQSDGNDSGRAFWYCEPYHQQFSSNEIRSRIFVVNTGTAAYALVGPFDYYASCSFIFDRATRDNQTYDILVSEYTYTPPPPGYVQPPFPSSGPNGTPIPTQKYATAPPTAVPTPAPTLCLATPGPSQYGPGSYVPCPTPVPTATPPPSACAGHWWCIDVATTTTGGGGTWQLMTSSNAVYGTPLTYPTLTSGTSYNWGWTHATVSGSGSGLYYTTLSTSNSTGCNFAGTSARPFSALSQTNVFSGTSTFTANSNCNSGQNPYTPTSFYFSLDPNSTFRITLWIDPVGWTPTAAPGASPGPSASASPGPTCRPNELCLNGQPVASGTPGGGTGGNGTGSGSGTGQNGLGDGNGLGPNTQFCRSTGHPVGPISGQCKAFMVDYWSVGVCQPITDPLTAIGWVGCVLTQIVQALPNAIIWLVNGIIDLVEPGTGLATSFNGFKDDISARVPFCYIAPIVGQVSAFLAAPSNSGHAFPVSMTFPSVHGVGGGTFTLPDFSAAMPSWARSSLGALIYLGGALVVLRKVKGGLGGGENAD